MPNDKQQHLSSLISQIDALSREDLTVLNKYIVERSKSLDNTSHAEAIAQFTPGDLVSFIDKQGTNRQAIVIRKNKKPGALEQSTVTSD